MKGMKKPNHGCYLDLGKLDIGLVVTDGIARSRDCNKNTAD